jgi:thiamine biosynthesis protein ThiI
MVPPMLVTARYHEIALKGGNRPRFVAALAGNLQRALNDLGFRRVRHTTGRLVIELDDAADPDAQWRTVRDRVRCIFGVANFSRVVSVPRDLDAVNAAAAAAAAGRSFTSFRIQCKRGDKSFPTTSPDVCRVVGDHVRVLTGARVDLKHADLTIDVEIVSSEVLVSGEKVCGPGGLPVGISGRVVALLSGGIDSPVAAARLMRRGCRVTFVHFHSAPYLDRTSQEKARDLVGVLNRYQYRSTLYLVPFGDVQREIVAQVRRPHRVVLYRRMMFRIAEAIARRTGAQGLVTGESVGQVASQTLTNLATIDAVATMPVLRPLIGRDKNEIIDEAHQIETYAVSIVPDQDCCQLFVPRRPSTRTSAEEAEACEAGIDVSALCARAVDAATIETIVFSAGRSAGRACEAGGAFVGAADC